MTAAEHEVHDAQREGVTIKDGVMPVKVILGDDGRATALRMATCEMVDNRPTPVEGTEFDIECDLIVSAIGQGGDLEGLEDFDNGRGLIDADKFYAIPEREGHFVAGDIIRPHLLTTAIGQASIAAESINYYFNDTEIRKRPKVDVHHFDLLEKLQESGLEPEDYKEGEYWGTDKSKFSVHNFEDRAAQEIIPYDELFLGHFPFTPRLLREEHGPDAEQVLGHFEERMKSFSDEQAVEEAERCMSCGMCFECDNCVVYCPQDAVFRVKKDESTTGRYVDTDYNKCIGCHICADVCPTGYIDMALGH
jgi:Pyruvate/2-oxoacid:ferredoxin oxidoreductase delta subunit